MAKRSDGSFFHWVDSADAEYIQYYTYEALKQLCEENHFDTTGFTRKDDYIKLLRQVGEFDDIFKSKSSTQTVKLKKKMKVENMHTYSEEKDGTIDQFLDLFENQAKFQGFADEQDYPLLVQPFLAGPGSRAFSSAPQDEIRDWTLIRDRIENAYGISQETFRLKFRNLKKSQGMTFLDYAGQAKELCRKWFGESAILLQEEDAFDDVLDKLVIEQLISIVLDERLREKLRDVEAEADRNALKHVAEAADRYAQHRQSEKRHTDRGQERKDHNQNNRHQNSRPSKFQNNHFDSKKNSSDSKFQDSSKDHPKFQNDSNYKKSHTQPGRTFENTQFSSQQDAKKTPGPSSVPGAQSQMKESAPSSSGSPYLHLKLGTLPYLGLVDTGCDRSALSPTVAEELNAVLEPSTRQFETVDKRQIQILGAEQKKLILSAMSDWEARTCITFRPWKPADNDWIYIQDPGTDGICNAVQGKSGGKQTVNLARKGCMWKSTVQHEFGHTLGLSHEHQHPHRDEYITLVAENVKPESMKWMKTLSADDHNYFGLDFDMDSVMTYGSWSNAKGKERTMLTKDPSLQHRLDNYHKYLSYSDAAIVSKMVKCGKNCGKDIQCPTDSYLDDNCKCITPQIYYDTWCKDTGTPEFCFDKAARGKCSEAAVLQQCQKTCDTCPMYHVKRNKWNGGCENKYYIEAKCSEWAQAGHCSNTKYRKYMIKWCSKACRTCDINPDCLDTGECDGHDRANCEADSTYHPWMMDNCKNWCGKGPATCVKPTKVPGECKDKTDCNGYSKEFCQEGSEFKPFMMDNCRKWCGACQGAADEPASPTECEDKKDCNGYSREFCQEGSEFEPFMMDNCRKWCGACKGAADEPATPTVCEDKVDCSGYSTTFCETSSEFHSYMTDKCAKFCGTCT